MNKTALLELIEAAKASYKEHESVVADNQAELYRLQGDYRTLTKILDMVEEDESKEPKVKVKGE